VAADWRELLQRTTRPSIARVSEQYLTPRFAATVVG